MNKELFTRFINNECTTEEIDKVVKWLQNEAGTIDGKAIVRQIWNDLPQTDIHHLKGWHGISRDATHIMGFVSGTAGTRTCRAASVVPDVLTRLAGWQ